MDIIVNAKAHPTRDWVNFAHTTSAKNKIRRYLKTYEREVNLQLGRERLDLALKAMGASGVGAVQDEDLEKFLAGTKYTQYGRPLYRARPRGTSSDNACRSSDPDPAKSW